MPTVKVNTSTADCTYEYTCIWKSCTNRDALSLGSRRSRAGSYDIHCQCQRVAEKLLARLGGNYPKYVCAKNLECQWCALEKAVQSCAQQKPTCHRGQAHTGTSAASYPASLVWFPLQLSTRHCDIQSCSKYELYTDWADSVQCGQIGVWVRLGSWDDTYYVAGRTWQAACKLDSRHPALWSSFPGSWMSLNEW